MHASWKVLESASEFSPLNFYVLELDAKVVKNRRIFVQNKDFALRIEAGPELDVGPIFLTRPNPTHSWTRPVSNSELARLLFDLSADDDCEQQFPSGPGNILEKS